MTIKVIATDMDGTFLDEAGRYDKTRFDRILRALEDRDMRFVVASGNSMSRLIPMFADTHHRLHFVAENGAQVISQGRVIRQEFLETDELGQFLDYFDHDFLARPTIFNGETQAYMLRGTKLHFGQTQITEEEVAAMEASILQVADLSRLKEPLIKITMLLTPEEADRVSRVFNQDYQGHLVAVPSGFGAIDFIQTGLHKGWGLQQLLDYWDLDASSLLVFGDGDNDLEMLELAGTAYAMENASPKVLAVADKQAPHHKDQGVMTILEELLGLEEDDR